MGFSFILIIVIVLGGSMGIPVGIPPGPEDPMMARIAPENCLFYASWSGVAPIDPAANPTEKWLAQPKASKMIGKLRKAYRGYFLDRINKSGDPIVRLGNQLVVELIDTASTHPAGLYLDHLKIDGSEVSATGAAIIKLGSHQEPVERIFNELQKAFETLDKREFSSSVFQPTKVNGENAIKIQTGMDDASLTAIVRDGYFLVGIGSGALTKLTENMKTPAPQWLVKMRERLKVDRIASVGFADSKLIDQLKETSQWTGPFWLSHTHWLKGINSGGWIAGVDQDGFVARTEVNTDKIDKGFLSIIDLDPIPKRFVKEIPPEATVAVATRLSTKKILEMIRQSMRQSGQQDAFDDTLDQFQKLSGVRLEKDLLESVGDYVYAYYNFELAGLGNRGWIISVRIEDEMSFPEYFLQLNRGIKAWAKDAPNLEYKVKQHDQYEVHYIASGQPSLQYAWTVVDDQWYFAKTPDEIINHLKSRKKENLYLADETAKQIFDFGDKQGLGAPVMIGHLDLAEVLVKLRFFVEPTLKQERRISQDFDFEWTDFPSLDELTNEVKPMFAAIFKTENGFQLYQRQTYPGGSPPVTLATIGIASIPMEVGTLSAKTKMGLLGKAHLAYQAKHKRYCAAHSVDAAGKPLISWRVHLLPFLGYQDLYDQFHLNEPWDSEHNKSLIPKMPSIYRHPTIKTLSGETTFVVPTAAKAMFGIPPLPTGKTPLGLSPEEMKDPSSKTAMLLEVNKEHAVIWTKPADFHFNGDSIAARMFGIRESRKFVTVMADGSVRTIHCYWDQRNLNNMLNRSDRNKFEFPMGSLFQ